jgi:hypothetical protein
LRVVGRIEMDDPERLPVLVVERVGRNEARRRSAAAGVAGREECVNPRGRDVESSRYVSDDKCDQSQRIDAVNSVLLVLVELPDMSGATARARAPMSPPTSALSLSSVRRMGSTSPFRPGRGSPIPDVTGGFCWLPSGGQV